MRLFFAFFLILLLGCQATSLQKKEAKASIETSENSAEARSAIESVANAVTKNQVHVQYCPVCGRRFSPSVTKCPFDDSELKELTP